MKKSLYAAASAVALAAVAAPAMAGGLNQPVIEPAPVAAAPAPVVVAPGRDWTGFYAGAQLGYGWGDVDTDNGVEYGDVEGALGGLHVGFDRDFGQFVLGAEASYNAADLSTEGFDLDQMTRIGLRAGFDAGNALVFLTGGYANARIDVAGERNTEDGWFAGIGVDYMLTDNWSLGGQVLTHQFDNVGTIGADVQATTLEARASYRF